MDSKTTSGTVQKENSPDSEPREETEVDFQEESQRHTIKDIGFEIVGPKTWIIDTFILFAGASLGMGGAVLSIFLFKWLFVEDRFSVLQVILVVPWTTFCGLLAGGIIMSLSSENKNE